MKYYFAESGGAELNERKSIDIKEDNPKLNFTGADFGLSLAMLVCGFLYWNLVMLAAWGLGVLIFTAVLCGSVLWYFRAKGISQGKRGLAWLLLIMVSAFQFALFDGYEVKTINLLFLSLCFVYWVGTSTGRCLSPKLSVYSIWDLVNQLFGVPFSNFTCEYLGLKHGLSKNKHSRNAQYIVIGVIIFLPLMVFVIGQLVTADAAFESVIQRVLETISIGTVSQYLMHFAMGIPVACYLFGLIYGNAEKLKPHSASQESLNRGFDSVGFAPRLTVYTVMIGINLIYLVFFAAQAAYFLSAFEGNLPGGFTYAEYARRGFFELCRVSSLNMVLIFLANLFMVKKAEEKTSKMLRIQTALISLMTIGLIVTALSKMYMYIHTYGLTQLRVYTSWFMVMLLFAFAVIMFRQIKKFNASKIIIIGGIIGIMVLSYGNVDGNIAKYNIQGYESGRLEYLDYNALMRLSDGAVPHVYELYKKTEDEQIRQILYGYITNQKVYGEVGYSQGDRIKNFNLQSFRADNIGGLLQSEGLGFSEELNLSGDGISE